MGSGFQNKLISVVFALGAFTHSSFAGTTEELAEGIQYSEFACSLGAQKIEYKSITQSPTSPYRVRLIDNPTVRAIDKDPYVGETLPAWLQKRPKRSIVGGINGNFFGTFYSRKGNYPGYRSTGLLWSTASRPHLNSPLRVSPLKDWGKPGSILGGDALVVSANKKIIVGNMIPECGSDGKCKVKIENAVQSGFPEKMATPQTAEEFHAALEAGFPTMEYAMQILMPLNDPERFACKPTGKDAWCQRAARTVLCIGNDDSVSLMTANYALIEDLARTLITPTTQCEKKCRYAFNLDGGGSTQMIVRNPTTKQFEMRKGGSSPRPVQNFFVVEKN